MARDTNRANIVFIIAALVGVGTAAYFIVRSYRGLEPSKRLERMLDYCANKRDELEKMLEDEAQPSASPA